MTKIFAMSFFLVLLAGCAKSDVPVESPTPIAWASIEIPGYRECVRETCVADPDSRDARTMKDRWNLTQLNFDENGEVKPAIEGDVLVWQKPKAADREAEIVVMNLSTRTIFPLAVGDGVLQTRPFLRDARVLFTEQRADLTDLARLRYWDEGSGRLTDIDPGLGGEQVGVAFDGTWAVFRQRGGHGDTSHGLWAINIETKEKVRLYAPPAGMTSLNATEFLWEETAAVDGRVYLVLDKKEGETWKESLLEVNITQGSKRVVHSDSVDRILRLVASDEYVAWESNSGSSNNQVVRVWSRHNSTVFNASSSKDHAAFPAIAGNWILFHTEHETNPDLRGITAVNVEDGRRHLILGTKLEYDESTRQWENMVSASWSSSDGKTAVIQAHRMNPNVFDTLHSDLYLWALPT